MPLIILREDITHIKVDAIVNAANPALQMGSGVCGAIFNAAGMHELLTACNALGHCDVGRAVITPGFRLPARFIIHTPGPIWRGGNQGEESLLSDCYTNSLNLAHEHELTSIAFPLISSGNFGYPVREALRVASRAIRAFLEAHDDDMRVYLLVFGHEAFWQAEWYAPVRDFLSGLDADTFAKAHRFHALRDEAPLGMPGTSRHIDMPLESACPPMDKVSLQREACRTPSESLPKAATPRPRNLDEFISHLDEPFSESLLRLIDQKGLTDVQAYKRANIDRKLFSKIRAGRGYNPSKGTVLALAVALALSMDETRDLLSRAGYALSRSSKADLIVQYFIENGNHDIFEINEALFAFDQPILGG